MPEALAELAFQAFQNVSRRLRPSRSHQLRGILDDPEASANHRLLALDLEDKSTSFYQGLE